MTVLERYAVFLQPKPGTSSSSSQGGAAEFVNKGPHQQPQTLEELLERQWEQGSQFLMEQASHFDSKCSAYSLFFIGPTSASFLFIFIFSYNNKHLEASEIQTRICGSVGKSADHYTTTTDHLSYKLLKALCICIKDYETQRPIL